MNHSLENRPQKDFTQGQRSILTKCHVLKAIFQFLSTV